MVEKDCLARTKEKGKFKYVKSVIDHVTDHLFFSLFFAPFSLHSTAQCSFIQLGIHAHQSLRAKRLGFPDFINMTNFHCW